MNIPEELKYTEEHEWVKIEDNIATIGITDFAQGELGDIVYLEIDSLDSEIALNEVFGTVEAVKTVSDLFIQQYLLLLQHVGPFDHPRYFQL